MTRSFKLLGSLEIHENGRLSPLMKSAKGCALLTYLIITNQSQTRAHLADLLWEATSTADSLRNLRRLLHTVRRAIPDLTITRQALSFQPDAPVHIDYVHISNALEQADLKQLDEALKLYSGDLLAGFYLEDAPYFNEWLSLAREQFRVQVMDAYHRLCTSYNTAQAWQAGISVAQRWLTVDKLNEAAQRWLIQFLAANGQTAEALEQYERCRAALWDELSVEPEDATQHLIAQIQRAHSDKSLIPNPTAKWQPDPLPQPDTLANLGPLPPHAFLPYQRNDDFTGRKADLIALANHLLPWEVENREDNQQSSLHDAASAPAVAISGMGGLGKTQLAVEFAYRYGRFYEGGVYWLSFAQAGNVTEEIANIGGERGMKLFKEADGLTIADQAGRVQQTWQEATPRLLIFDNCEEEALLKQWLPVTGGCRVLLTSRRNSWPRELGVTIHSLDKLARAESVALLKQLAPEATDQAQAAVQQIATELGDHPLALHLAGSFLARYKRIAPERYLDQLRQLGLLQHPSLQGRGINYSPTGHELHVARTFAINSEQFESDNEVHTIARQLLTRAACFSPSEAIPRLLLHATISGGDENDLMSELLAEDGVEYLLALGFIEGKKETVTMHPLIAAFVRDNLADRQAAHDAVTRTILRLIANQQQTTHSLFSLPIPTNQLRYITNWGLKEPTPQAAALANIFGQHLIERHDYDGAVAFLQQTLPINEALFGQNQPQTAANLIHLGTSFVKKGLFEVGSSHFQQAINLLKQLPSTSQPNVGQTELALAYSRLSEVSSKMGNFAEALKTNQEALAIYETIEGANLFEIATCFHFRGTIFFEMGNFELAQEPYEQAIAGFQQLFGEKSISVARIRGDLGWLYMQGGRYAKAGSALEEAFLVLENEVGVEHQYTLSVLHSLGQLYYERGDYKQAEATLTTGLKQRQKLVGDVHHTTAFMQTDLGIVLRELKRYQEAEPLLQGALSTREQIYGPTHSWTARSLNHLGKLYLEMGDVEKAAVFLERAWLLNVENNPEHLSMADSLDYRGDLLAKTGNLTEASTLWLQAKRIREGAHGANHPKMAATLNRLARWHWEKGETEEAKQLAKTAVSLLKSSVRATQLELVAAKEMVAREA